MLEMKIFDGMSIENKPKHYNKIFVNEVHDIWLIIKSISKNL